MIINQINKCIIKFSLLNILVLSYDSEDNPLILTAFKKANEMLFIVSYVKSRGCYK